MSGFPHSCSSRACLGEMTVYGSMKKRYFNAYLIGRGVVLIEDQNVAARVPDLRGLFAIVTMRQGVEALRDVLRHLDKVDDAEEEGAADVDGGIVLPLIVAKTVRVYALAGVLSWVSADRRELRVQVRRTN